MIGVMAVVALLIAGAIYFFVIRDNDSAVDADVDAQTNGQEETGTETGTGTEDDQEADEPEEEFVVQNDNRTLKLENLGFDCQALPLFEGVIDPEAPEFFQKLDEKGANSGLSDTNYYTCAHSNERISVDFLALSDADLSADLAIETICELFGEDGEGEVHLKIYEDNFKKQMIIGSYAYQVHSDSDRLRFETLLNEEEVEYEAYDAPEASCAN